MIGRFRYLNVGLAAVLIFVGAKMMLVEWIKLPIVLSLGVVAGLLTLSILASILRSGGSPEDAPRR
jgi:tellurite resistance protein TerC